MATYDFPHLGYTEWHETLTTMQQYAQVVGKIRRALAPKQKHWWHVGLQVGVNGPTTTPIPARTKTFELTFDLTAHKLILNTSYGEQWQNPLPQGQSVAEFCQQTLSMLALLDIEPEIDENQFSDNSPCTYDVEAVGRYWAALVQVNALLNQFKGELREETGPVMLWPHHIDLAMLWFSGRLVPDQDPDDEEHADEQMNFGFSPGDDAIPEPYFYITAYPVPNGFTDTSLPADAQWTTEGFTGALMRYSALVNASDPADKLLTFWRTVQKAGANLMK